MEQLDIIIAAIFASTGFWTFLTAIVSNSSTRKKATVKALKGLLHDKIYENCILYINRGYVTVDELENLDYIYKPYRELGGNGTGEILYNEVQTLPKRNQNETEKEN